MDASDRGIRLLSFIIDLEDVFEKYVRNVLRAFARTICPGLPIKDGNLEGRGDIYSVLVQSEMEKKCFPLVKIPPLWGGDFRGMRIYRPMSVSRCFALAR